MNPYYEDELVTLYHGDCREITAWLEADVLVTDPPYGMAYSGFAGRKGEPRRRTGPLTIAGDLDPAIRDAVLRLWGDRPALVFGTWRIPRPDNTRQVIVWDKSANGPGMGALDLPWGPSHEEVYVLGSGWVGKRGGSVYAAKPFTSGDAERPDHPTPKPVGLMERRAIGVELDERYCEMAAKRLGQDTLFGGVA